MQFEKIMMAWDNFGPGQMMLLNRDELMIAATFAL